MSRPIFNALIRTHHITSRKKVGKLREAASTGNIYALVRSSGCPGIMYCQGTESGVKAWVANVQRLRYKDFHLVRKPAEKVVEPGEETEAVVPSGRLEEVDSVREYGVRMEALGVLGWWRRGMGYASDPESM